MRLGQEENRIIRLPHRIYYGVCVMLYLKNVVYHPPASPEPILNGVELQLDAQQLGLIIGVSGAGKTTLLEILAGLAEANSGEIYWRDQFLTPLHLQQLGGLVFQFPERHFCGSTIVEELRLGHPEIKTEHIHKALGEVGLSHLSLETAPYTLSGGQQRRLALAVQLIRQPYLLLLDEPTAGLDWSMRSQLLDLLKRLKKDWTLLIVTHDAAELGTIADQTWRLVKGKLIPI